MQKIFQGGGGANLGYGQKRGAKAYVGCYTLHLLGGGKNDTRGMPPSLNTALAMVLNPTNDCLSEIRSTPIASDEDE